MQVDGAKLQLPNQVWDSWMISDKFGCASFTLRYSLFKLVLMY